MKNNIFIFAGIALCFSTENSFGQSMSTARIDTVLQVGQTVEFSVTADEQFYVGGNRYVLYIGIRPFTIARQSDTGGKGLLTFLIHASEFNALPDGGKIYLSYGEIVNMDDAGTPAEEIASSMPGACKYLDVFTKKMLRH